MGRLSSLDGSLSRGWACSINPEITFDAIQSRLDF